MISYAQNFEDVMLARVFADRSNGFYVDVGAADPINLSVTKWFYDLGWRGLNIEPNRELFDRLVEDRAGDINLDCGVGAISSLARFAELSVGELSSFDPTVQQTADNGGLAITTRMVQVFPLTDLLAKHSGGRSIDFLKVDVEGWEAEVFRGLDLYRFRPIVILAEATRPQTQISSHGEWEPLLLAAEYSFVYFDGVNRYYLANEQSALKRHFDSPPNAFDEFETYPLMRAKADAEQRLQVIDELHVRLAQATTDADQRLTAINELQSLLARATTDADQRLTAINELQSLLARATTDADQRLTAINELQSLLARATTDADQRLTAINELQSLLARATTDAELCLAATQELEIRYRALEESRQVDLSSISSLQSAVAGLKANNNDLEERNEELASQLAQTNASLDRIRATWIWRITHPAWSSNQVAAKRGTLLGRPTSADTAVAEGLRTIVVDLTPVLPGGENGGAKVFVLELLRRLAELAPQTQFVLLTQAAAHEELATLDRANIRRVMVLDLGNPPALRSLAAWVTSRLVNTLPGRPGRFVQRVIDRIRLKERQFAGSVVKELRADLLFCPFTAPNYFEPGIPMVSVIYDLQYKTYPNFFAPADVAQRDRTFLDAARRASLLVAISEYSRQTAIKHGALDPASIKTVHLHISKHSLRDGPRDEPILERLGLVARQYLIYPANFWKHKNHEMLLTAFGIARSNGLDGNIRLVCTGAPSERQRWLKRASEGLGLDEHVLFPGYLASAELLSLTTSSSGMIFPSLYEGFGLPVIEAMASGVPVACSNVTSLPEVAGDAAILFDPRVPDEIAAAMLALVQDKKLTAQLVRSGTARAGQFSNSRLMAREYWEVFEKASSLANQTSFLVGVYPDGWVGRSLIVQVARATTKRKLELEISIPEWAPFTDLTIQVRQGIEQITRITASRGESAIVHVPLPLTGGTYEFTMSAAFIPKILKMGDDKRQLSVSLVRCDISDTKGNRAVLFPENA